MLRYTHLTVFFYIFAFYSLVFLIHFGETCSAITGGNAIPKFPPVKQLIMTSKRKVLTAEGPFKQLLIVVQWSFHSKDMKNFMIYS